MQRVYVPYQCAQCVDARHDGLCDTRNVATPISQNNQRPKGANGGVAKRPNPDHETRRVCNAESRSSSGQPKLESTMIVSGEHYQEEQPHSGMVVRIHFQLPRIVNVGGSEDLVARHITPERKTLIFVPM